MKPSRSITRKWLRHSIAAITLGGLFATACTGAQQAQDGEATPTAQAPQTAAAADVTAFCTAAIQGEATFIAGPEVDEQGDPTPEGLEAFTQQMLPLVEELESNAPQEIAGDVDVIVQGVRQALEQGDPSATETPEFFRADDALDDYVFDNCELEAKQEIVGVEYAYEGVPATLSAGQTGIRLTNQGEEVHEVAIFRINDDADRDFQELLQMPEEEAQSLLEFRGAALAGPGESGSAVVDLEPGRYGFVCFLPVGSTSLDAVLAGGPGDESTASPAATEGGAPTESGTEAGEGPPHFTQGMFAEVEVN